jgi:DNA-binding FrmR family transcriptional regulator
MQEETKDKCLQRLSRIEGQVRGIARMVGDDRYCIDIITQISAVQAACLAIFSLFRERLDEACHPRNLTYEALLASIGLGGRRAAEFHYFGLNSIQVRRGLPRSQTALR